MNNIKFKDTKGQLHEIDIDSIDDIQKIYLAGKIDQVRLIVDNKEVFVNYRNWKKVRRQVNAINKTIIGRRFSGMSISNEPVSILIRKISSITYMPDHGYVVGFPIKTDTFRYEDKCSITKEQFKYLLNILEND